MAFAKPKGTNDFFGKQIAIWQHVEKTIREICDDFGVTEIRTPMFETTDLFQRGVGETTDIVQKEMFTFQDQGGRSLTLRPEGTASAARAYIENGLYNEAQPMKLYYISPTFRAERPQKGRYRQFHQFGVEIFGSYSPAADAEMVSIAVHLVNRLGVKNTTLHINSLGNNESRAAYNAALTAYIGDNLEKLCPTCRERFVKNPLRVLDCKVPDCKEIVAGAPRAVDSLLPECKKHFDDFQACLTEMGIPFVVDPGIVRGLDYYTRTVFEIVSTDLGAQGTVCGGGRYDNLVAEVGGPQTGATGFGLGLERLAILLEESGVLDLPPAAPVLYVGAMGEAGFLKAQAIVYKLRQSGVYAEADTVGRSVKAQFKYADKIGAKYAVMLGDNELAAGSVSIKRMETSEQEMITIDNIESYIKEKRA